MARTLSIMHYSENGFTDGASSKVGFMRGANDNTWYFTVIKLYENGEELPIMRMAYLSIVDVVNMLKELKKEGWGFKYEMC